MNDIVVKFNSMRLLIDKLHFPVSGCLIQILFFLRDLIQNHVDEYCKQNCNPNKFPDLAEVNSVVCEQCFSWSNHFKNVKAMSSERFAHYWNYIFDLHNYFITNSLHHVANPKSRYRTEYILNELMDKSMKM